MAKINLVELQISVDGVMTPVDTDQSSSFNFNLQASDLTNPSVTKIPYSAQITLPKTQNNNNIFSQIWKIDNKVLKFNPMKRTDFILYLNNNLYQTGYIKLEEITKYNYKIRLFGGLGDYFHTLSEKKLSELDFGKEFDHTISRSFVNTSWSSMPKTGQHSFLGYAMAYQGKYDNFDSESYVNNSDDHGVAQWEVQNKRYTSPDLNEHRRSGKSGATRFYGEYRSYYQRPMVKVQKIINKIFEDMKEKGWTTNPDSSFFNPYNPYWEDLWMICPQYETTGEQTGEEKLLEGKQIPRSYMFWGQETYQVDLDIEVERGKRCNVVANMPCKILAEYYDGNHDEQFFKQDYLIIIAELRIGKIKKTLRYVEGGDSRIYLGKYNVGSKKPKNYKDIGIKSDFWYDRVDPGQKIEWNSGSPGPGSQYTFTGSIAIDEEDDIGDGKVFLDVTYIGSTMFEREGKWNRHRYARLVFQSGAKISVNYSSGSGIRSDNPKVGYADIIRSDETCYDFLSSYCKLFNLHFIKDPYKKEVKIETRNTLFGDQLREEWTHKIDYSKDFTLKPILFDFRRGVFKWPGAGTKYEEEYLAKYSKEYGAKYFDTNNEFSDTDNNFLDGLIFSNCVVATGSSPYYLDRSKTIFKDNKTIPYLQDNSDEKVDTNFVLLFRAGTENVENSRRFIITDDNIDMLTHGYAWTEAADDSVTAYRYPKLTRVISRNGEDFSLNFDATETAYNDEEKEITVGSESSSTLFSRFWGGFINDRSDSNCRILTCYVYLDITEIQQNLFNKFIFINDTVWVINKIHNFNPLDRNPTKVELVSVQNIESYVSQKYIAGNLEIYRNGEKIYNAGASAETENAEEVNIEHLRANPLTVRIGGEVVSLELRLQPTVSWKLTNVPTNKGFSVSREFGDASPNMQVPLVLSFPANTGEDAVVYGFGIRWGSTTTLIQIVQGAKWKVAAVSDIGKVMINGREEPDGVTVADGDTVIFTTEADEENYIFSHWIIDGGYYYSRTENYTVEKSVTAEAVWLDKSAYVIMAREDARNQTRLQKTSLNYDNENDKAGYWLLKLGAQFVVLNEEDDISGFEIQGIGGYTEVGKSFLANENCQKLTAIYDSLLVNINVYNETALDFDAEDIEFIYRTGAVEPVELELAGVVEAGSNGVIRYRELQAAEGRYTLSVGQVIDDGYITMETDEFEYNGTERLYDINLWVDRLGWEEEEVELEADEESVECRLFVPRGMRFVLDVEDLTEIPEVPEIPPGGGPGDEDDDQEGEGEIQQPEEPKEIEVIPGSGDESGGVIIRIWPNKADYERVIEVTATYVFEDDGDQGEPYAVKTIKITQAASSPEEED